MLISNTLDTAHEFVVEALREHVRVQMMGQIVPTVESVAGGVDVKTAKKLRKQEQKLAAAARNRKR